MADRRLIADFEGTELVEGVFAIHNTQLGRTKNGKPFLKCLIADKSGRTPGRMWNVTEELFQTLPTDGFVSISGQAQPYQGEVQVIIQNIRPVAPTANDLKELLPSTRFNTDEMFAEVKGFLESIESAQVKALAEAYLNDEDLMRKFRLAPAAMELHHAYMGGLLEHTLNMLRLVDVICPLYPQLNRDIMMFGAFLHDLGKCAELKWLTGFSYTDEGQLVGHITIGAIWLTEKAKACDENGQEISKPLLNVLQHIILSHHGIPEYGAVKIPATPEAIAISKLDDLDAKMEMAISAARLSGNKPANLGGNFTEKIWALDTRLYRPDPTDGE